MRRDLLFRLTAAGVVLAGCSDGGPSYHLANGELGALFFRRAELGVPLRCGDEGPQDLTWGGPRTLAPGTVVTVDVHSRPSTEIDALPSVESEDPALLEVVSVEDCRFTLRALGVGEARIRVTADVEESEEHRLAHDAYTFHIARIAGGSFDLEPLAVLEGSRAPITAMVWDDDGAELDAPELLPFTLEPPEAAHLGRTDGPCREPFLATAVGHDEALVFSPDGELLDAVRIVEPGEIDGLWLRVNGGPPSDAGPITASFMGLGSDYDLSLQVGLRAGPRRVGGELAPLRLEIVDGPGGASVRGPEGEPVALPVDLAAWQEPTCGGLGEPEGRLVFDLDDVAEHTLRVTYLGAEPPVVREIHVHPRSR